MRPMQQQHVMSDAVDDATTEWQMVDYYSDRPHVGKRRKNILNAFLPPPHLFGSGEGLVVAPYPSLDSY